MCAAFGCVTARFLDRPAPARAPAPLPSCSDDAAALRAALAPLEQQLRWLAERPLPVVAERTAVAEGSTEPASSASNDHGTEVAARLARLEESLARCERLLAARLAPGSDATLERQLSTLARSKDAQAVAAALEELARDEESYAARFAWTGPVAVAEQFGAPDDVTASDGTTWWYWRLDEERTLGVAFSNGLVCAICEP